MSYDIYNKITIVKYKTILIKQNSILYRLSHDHYKGDLT